MARLRLANVEETKRYYMEPEKDENGNDIEVPLEEQDWIELRMEITKREASSLLKFAPRKEDDLDGGLRFIEKAFADLITGWSLPVDANVENYNLLDAAGANWVDRTVGKHLRVVLGSEAEAAEGKQDD